MSTVQVAIAEIEIDGRPRRLLVFDEEAFDYEISEEELSKAIQFCGRTEEAKKVLNGEIQSHFIACLSEFLGWEVTLEDVMSSIKSGEIEKKGEACTL